MQPLSIGVVGAGIIGLSIGWECVRRGHLVTVYDPQPHGGASRVAAGMLAPASEAYFDEPEMAAFLAESAACWPDFADQLSEVSGRPLGYRTEGTLQVGITAADRTELARLWRHQRAIGQQVVDLSADELRSREPSLHPRAGGVWVPGDHQVDPRLVVAALATLVRVEPRSVTDLSELDEQVVVLAAGVHSARLAPLPVWPVQGVLLRLRPSQPLAEQGGLRHVIRGSADGRPIYLVPRVDGEVLVGATVEDRADGRASAGAVRDLLRAGTDLVPELADYHLVETNVGHRPATPDNGPILGRLNRNLFVATGHYRHGVLAAPLTAGAIADLIDGMAAPASCTPFSPDRFGPARRIQ